MEEGAVIEEGDVYDVITRPKTATARSFLGALAGGEIPAGLAARLRPPGEGGQKTALRLKFSGPRAVEPILSRLTLEQGIEVAVLQAQVDEIGGRPFGSMIIVVPSAALADGSAEAFLRDHDAQTERLGHVA
jgi:D-methionine transport system ATP-binding protein